jgi:hypothetical protein
MTKTFACTEAFVLKDADSRETDEYLAGICYNNQPNTFVVCGLTHFPSLNRLAFVLGEGLIVCKDDLFFAYFIFIFGYQFSGLFFRASKSASQHPRDQPKKGAHSHDSLWQEENDTMMVSIALILLLYFSCLWYRQNPCHGTVVDAKVHPQNVRFQNVRFQNVRFQNV